MSLKPATASRRLHLSYVSVKIVFYNLNGEEIKISRPDIGTVHKKHARVCWLHASWCSEDVLPNIPLRALQHPVRSNMKLWAEFSGTRMPLDSRPQLRPRNIPYIAYPNIG